MDDFSRIRLDLARRVAAACPAALGQEIAATGSAARGVATRYSDLELNIWVAQLPAPETWHAWLASLGATSISPDTWEEDVAGFRWMVCRIGGIWVEVGWARIDVFDRFAHDLAAGRFVGHERLQMGWMVEQAVPLRSSGNLIRWKQLLLPYPDTIAARIVADQTSVWADPHAPEVRWALAARGERMGLAMRLLWDMQNLLRVLFAINRVWDRDLKWTNPRALDLAVKPDDLSMRIDAIFTLTDLWESATVAHRLILEVLQLAADAGFDVGLARNSVRDSLDLGQRLRAEHEEQRSHAAPG